MTGPVRGIPWARLFAEGAVIVVSILLAFAIDASWNAAQERSREESYLRQLAADLEGTLSSVERFGGVAGRFDRANVSLVRSYYQAEPPSRDSLTVWLNNAIRYAVVQSRLGTVEALVSTGDLALIRDDSLQTAITGYLTGMEQFEEFEADGERMFIEARNRLAGYIDPFENRLETLPSIERDSIAGRNPMYPFPTGRLRALPPLDLLTIVRTPEVHQIVVQLFRAKRAMRTNRARMRRASEDLLERVQAEQAHE